MSEEKETPQPPAEFKAAGTLNVKGVTVNEQSSIDSLSQRGYGVAEKNALMLSFYEALFLVDKRILSVKSKKGVAMDFQMLLKEYEAKDDNAWMHYLVYRDLRSRGYVVREGFGAAIDFRIYERGQYGKDAANSLVLSMQEGKPTAIEDLGNALTHAQSLKKELVLAVLSRRGEIVYYSVAPLTFK